MPLTRPSAAQINTVITTISDPITVLNKGSTLANIDVGFIINRNGGALANTAIFWNESANTFVTAFTAASGATDANISISAYANLRVNTLTATFVNATGNVSTAVVNAGQINTTGNVLATTGVFNNVIVNTGNVNSVGGYFVGNGYFLTGIVAGSSYSNVQVATYLPTYTGNIANIRLGIAGVLTFADGTTQITAGGGSYSNVQVATYLPTHSGTVSASLINSTGNVLATGLSVFGNARVGLAGAVSGQFHTVVGNITQTSSGGAVYINTTGNISAAIVNTSALNATGTTTAVAINSTGFINTTANISAAVVNAGALNATGNLTASQVAASNGIFVNNMTIATSYTIPTGYGASSVGAVTINSGVVVTVPSGSRWVVL